MKYFLPFLLLLLAASHEAFAQCKLIALDQVDEFDSTRVVASKPFNIGVLTPSGNMAENLEGQQLVEEGKAIFSFGNEHNIRSFFLTLAVVERKFYMIEPDYNVYLKFVDGPIIQLLNVPEDGEFDRKVLMWKYVHTCVVPLEYFFMLRDGLVEKIRIEYNDFKETIVLEPKQQQALQAAVKCVEERLNSTPSVKP
ncbi:MAG: hypothetical protein K9J37_22820 [Saprospiraceae bacterium]|nr:hypothetical protein [Saprospiraceae bacterium]MCF8252759.1 hypothetical protein [Saprospiraceae bacterium]MCF8283131.1 hypothetical protein [Bacteroidales bacterium]MCF8314305.1 hypothetical protein [Saprospiraceae bacterium]MCF8443186.1 hypothetical protein [Saprospiraceae bacterium]